MRTKRFDNEEWRKHNKLAILTFQLAQIEFHLNTWKSITTCRLDPTRNDSRQQGWTPKSLDCKKRPKPLPVEKPKMFDDTEWKLHRRLADIAFKLVQLDFHDLMPVLRSVEMRISTYWNLRWWTRLLRIVWSKFVNSSLWIRTKSCLITKHNELVIELRNFIPLCSIKPPILDKAHRMYRMNKHERWDTATVT